MSLFRITLRVIISQNSTIMWLLLRIRPPAWKGLRTTECFSYNYDQQSPFEDGDLNHFTVTDISKHQQAHQLGSTDEHGPDLCSRDFLSLANQMITSWWHHHPSIIWLSGTLPPWLEGHWQWLVIVAEHWLWEALRRPCTNRACTCVFVCIGRRMCSYCNLITV